MNDLDFKQLTQSARDANLVDYFTQSAYTTQHHGAEIYIKEFPGLCVNVNTNKWYSHYEGVGGSNAIDCLVKACGRDFKQAVYELTGQDIEVSERPRRCMIFMERPWLDAQPSLPQAQHKEGDEHGEAELRPQALRLPERGANMRRVFAYFCKERKIPSAVVEELAHAKLLYQSAGQIATTVNGIPQIAKPPNAVFVHRNENGEAIGGEVQGINSFKRYKGLVAGTGDSVFTFTPRPATEGVPKSAYLFESGIDLLSYYALADKETLQGVSLISMAGLKPIVPNQLKEQGVNVLSYVDNDEAGRKFEKDNNFKRGCDTLERAGVKDWNDALKKNLESLITVKCNAPEVETKETLPTVGGVIRK
jgi:hypothetical protein